MIDWKKAKNEAEMKVNTRRKKSGLAVGITKSGAMTLSSGLRDHLLEKNPQIQYAHPGYWKKENIIMIEFLTNGDKEGACKISNLHTKKGTSGFTARTFFTQVGLDHEKVNGKYKVEPIEELDGEWWFFRLK